MKAVRFHAPGGPEVLTYEDVPDPAPGPGEVLIGVEAAGVNFADVMRRRDDPYPEPSPRPFTPGVEVAGTVAALGAGVDGLALGTSVFAASGTGGYAQYAAVTAAMAIPLPPGLDAIRATALVLQGLTASLVLKEAGRLRAGESVLVQAAAGGVGSLAVQLARLFGAGTVVAAASTSEKRRLALELGADVAVDYGDPAWVEEVRAATWGRGVDLVLDMVGGAVSRQSFATLAEFGRLVVYGQASGSPAPVDPQSLLVPNHVLIGFYIGPYLARPELIQATLAELVALAASGRLRLHVGHVLPLAQAAVAHRMLEARETTGKIVLDPWRE